MRRHANRRRIRPGLRVAAAGLLLWSAGCAGVGPTPGVPAAAGPAPPELLGFVVIPPGDDPAEPLGGLSGLHWDARSEILYAISDDKGNRGTPRIYELSLALRPGEEPPLSVDVRGRIALEISGRASGGVDPESLAPTPDGDGFFVGSEGWIERGAPPFIARFDREGRHLYDLPLPRAFQPGPDRGPRQNQVFESLTASPSGRYLFAAAETGLIQDAPDSDLGAGSLVRILRWNVDEERWDRQFVYPTDPVHARPVPPNGYRTAGLTELLALDDDTLLALERSFAQGRGFGVRVYRVELGEALDVSRVPGDLGDLEAESRASKELFLDFGTLGVPVDNVEGLTLGPPLPDGRSSLLLVTDDNFQPESQSTQLLLFAWKRTLR